MKEDVQFFTNTESANFCDWIVGCSSFYYFPFDVVGDVVPFETPDISTECSPFVVLISSVDVRVMLVVPGLHWIVSTASVGFPVVGVCPGYSGFVHQVVYHAAFAREYLTGFRGLFRST